MIHSTSGLDRWTTQIKNDLTVIAVGTGAAPIASATQLTNELYRDLITETTDESTTFFIKDLYIDENNANGTITEFGILGNGATDTGSTGQLFASEETNLVKDNTQSLTISVEVELVEVTE